MSIRLELASEADLLWAQSAVTAWHYLHTPVDPRCSVLGYVVRYDGERAGCLLFGRPEATCCYQGDLTYGSQADVASGRARFDRWEVINLARVWLDPRLQRGGVWYGAGDCATRFISMALQRIVVDYLHEFPPCYINEPWRLKACLSYCDTSIHSGTIYKAAGFRLARTNINGIQTWYRPLRGLQGHERTLIERYCAQSYRSRVYRSRRAAQAVQGVLF